MQLGVGAYDFYDCLVAYDCLTCYVISTRISGKYTSSNFNTNVLRKTGFRRFVGDQAENKNSFVS